MADVTLARVEGQIWLVGGEEFLDLLLVNQLPPDVAVELVDCAGTADMYALWTERSSEPTDGRQPWALNPQLTGRLVAGLGLAPSTVQFTPWSAMLDGAANDTIGAASTWLAANPGGVLVLRQVEGSAPGHADLQRLRLQLVQAALVRSGAAPDAIRKEPGEAGAEEEADRLHIVMQAAG